MGVIHRLGRKRTLARVAAWIAHASIALVIASAASPLGHHYVYCRAMQSVMSHACCAAHPSRSVASAQIASDCCSSVSMAAPDVWAPIGRSAAVFPPVSATVDARPLDARPVTAARLGAARDATLCAGPPKQRLHARFMVFHI